MKLQIPRLRCAPVLQYPERPAFRRPETFRANRVSTPTLKVENWVLCAGPLLSPPAVWRASAYFRPHGPHDAAGSVVSSASRHVSSAKSWLSFPGVDRRGKILPAQSYGQTHGFRSENPQRHRQVAGRAWSRPRWCRSSFLKLDQSREEPTQTMIFYSE